MCLTFSINTVLKGRIDKLHLCINVKKMFCVGDCKHCNLFAARLMIQIGWPLWEITSLKLTCPSNFWGIFSFFKEKTILEFLNLILSLHDLIVSKFRLAFEFDV